MANLPGEVCTRPPTCQGNCAKLKTAGEFLASGLCGGPGIMKLAERLAKTTEEKVGSPGLSPWIFAIPGAACGYAFDQAADYMYKNGDSFIECHPALPAGPIASPAPSGSPGP